jgi:tetratricopeptide (TPR) repeat protein
MSFFAIKPTLTDLDRARRRHLILTDTLSLVTLFAITALLAVLTNYLYQSYASHQVALANRWLQRGEQAMRDGKPVAAIDALRSALAYAPNQRSTEIKLAQALASAGRVQEATVYFNTLLETEQGDGLINLQLARLAARQGNEAQAIDDYQKAIYGSWQGDGYVRRRDVRFELINYLISRQHLDRARTELLVASGNAPADDLTLQLKIAETMEHADDPSDAFHLYKTILHHHPTLWEALDGAGRTAFQMGRYLEAKRYLARAVEGQANEQEPAATAQARQELSEATRLLLLYPSSRLSQREQNTRVLADRKLATDRLAKCIATKAAEPPLAPSTPVTAPSSGTASKPAASPLQSLASRLTGHPAQPTKQTDAPPSVDPLQALAARWQQQPAKISVEDLDADPDLAQTQIQLIYDTELTTQQVCGTPTGDDALLLKIAQAPHQVEEE